MSTIKKISVVVGKRKTSVSLEPEFRAALGEIAEAQGIGFAALVEKIGVGGANRSSALRVYILNHWRERAAAAASV